MLTDREWASVPTIVYDKLKDLTAYIPPQPTAAVRLDANENYTAPQLDWTEIARGTDLHRYPDPVAGRLCKLAAGYFGVTPDRIVAGNGSDELISIIVNGLLPQKARIVVHAPDFSMYAFYAALGERIVTSCGKNDGLQTEIEALRDSAQQADLLIFSNPCNPTGGGLTVMDMKRLLESLTCLVVIDEAYMDFWNESMIPFLDTHPNVIILRTCSKALGLAGVRLGFAIANQALTKLLQAVKSPYNVSSVTQAIGVAAFSEPRQLRAMTRDILINKEAFILQMDKLLDDIPLHRLPTYTNFLLLRGSGAELLYQFAEGQGIALRFLPPDLLRVSVGSQVENEAFCRALIKWRETI